jgi:hypothetical protein
VKSPAFVPTVPGEYSFRRKTDNNLTQWIVVKYPRTQVPACRSLHGQVKIGKADGPLITEVLGSKQGERYRKHRQEVNQGGSLDVPFPVRVEVTAVGMMSHKVLRWPPISFALTTGL